MRIPGVCFIFQHIFNTSVSFSGQRFVRQSPALDDARADRFWIVFEFDEFHCFLFDPFTGAFIDDVDVVADRTPFALDDQ